MVQGVSSWEADTSSKNILIHQEAKETVGKTVPWGHGGAEKFDSDSSKTPRPFHAMTKSCKNHSKIVGKENFIEIFVDTPLEECERRDVKGLYKKARAGEITNFTGIGSVYEAPANPNLTIDTTQCSVEDAVKHILNYINPKLKLKNG